MNKIFENKEKVQLISGVISLVALLLYTLVHTGGLLSHYIEPGFIGYVAAFGIELAVVSLSLRIGELRRSKQSTKFFLFVLISVVAVSAMANVAEGFFTLHDEQLTLETVKNLDIMQAVIGVMATGLVSLIVLALSEIVGTDVNLTAKLIEKERKAEAKKVSSTVEIDTQLNTTEQARQAKAEHDELTKQQRLDIMLNTLSQSPDVKITELGKAAGVSRTTVYTYLDELEQQGLIERNGHGVKVNTNGQGADNA